MSLRLDRSGKLRSENDEEEAREDDAIADIGHPGDAATVSRWVEVLQDFGSLPGMLNAEWGLHNNFGHAKPGLAKISRGRTLKRARRSFSYTYSSPLVNWQVSFSRGVATYWGKGGTMLTSAPKGGTSRAEPGNYVSGATAFGTSF